MLHDKPTNTAERLALHLETNYGLQLDAFRHSALVGEIKEFLDTYTARYLAAHQDAPTQEIPTPMGAVVALEESQTEPEKTNG